MKKVKIYRNGKQYYYTYENETATNVYYESGELQEDAKQTLLPILQGIYTNIL